MNASIGRGGMTMNDESCGSYSVSTDEGKSIRSGDSNFTDEETKKHQKPWWTLGWSRDTQNVFFWMVVVLGMIAITAAIVLSFTFVFLSNEEENEFKNGFQQQANVIAEATRFHAKTVVGSLESMSDTITSYTGATGASWPFVVIPDFDRRGQRARLEAYVEMIAFSPLVIYENRHRWSIFTEYGSGWLGDNVTSMPANIYRVEENETTGELMDVNDDNILMIPIWLTSPKPYNASLINFNLLSDSLYYFLFNAMTESKHTALSAVYKNTHMYDRLFAPGEHDRNHQFENIHKARDLNDDHISSSDSIDEEQYNSLDDTSSLPADDFPHSILMAPVYDSFNTSERNLAGVIHGLLPWDSYLTELLPPGVSGIDCVVVNSCGQAFTFRINGPYASYIGEGDLHNTKYDDMAQEVDFGSDFLGEETRTYRQCFYSLVVYPTEEFEKTFESSDTEKFTALLAVVFSVLALFFFIFVWFVQRRQQKVMGVAVRTTAIISELFPDNVRERIMTQAEAQANRELDGGSVHGHMDVSNNNLRTILQDTGSDPSGPFANSTHTRPSTTGGIMSSVVGKGISVLEDAPIADLYPHCTVFFADIVGFTAWSSTRDPAQVFVLLETLYGAFDGIAKRRRIFKVETIGDCYVAVSGLPQPRRDHALAMARFAQDCLVKSSEVFHCLEVTLGPGTSSLNMRLGLHSGPVTAGVLRGEKGRFQLFGDTVNTAARMESNSRAGKVLCSKDTADLILAAGKTNWVTERTDLVHAKGKGEMRTYWVHVKGSAEGESQTSGDSSESCLPATDPFESTTSFHAPSALPDSALNQPTQTISGQQARLVEWNAELLTSLLKNIVAGRRGRRVVRRGNSEPHLNDDVIGRMPFDEWAQAIDLPEKANRKPRSAKPVELPEEVVHQLRKFVATIACLHGENPFHSFSHASHVTMSVHKLLLRVIQSGEDSYRIASDPLTHFAAVLSALIHDVDHRGVPNAQLIKEEPELAAKYDGKSVAEQHAIDIAWGVLMGDEYADLRKAIYTTESELKRFRTVLVNSVLSTDIVNKDLKNLRNERWKMAFSEEQRPEMSPSSVDQYRASCVLEHLIQASDVSHTMQHWHVYRTWNEHLFEEMYLAYKQGRADKDPSLTWYEGELGFFDFYIIPLAKKLAEVGVFGVSSSEYLDFALKNRAEWEVKGKEVVASMLANLQGNDKIMGTEC